MKNTFSKIFLLCCSVITLFQNCIRPEEDFEFLPIPAIRGLDCTNFNMTGALLVGELANDVVLKVPYQTVNGLEYHGETVHSQGVS